MTDKHGPAYVDAECPYCLASNQVSIWEVHDDHHLIECWQCTGLFVTGVQVTIEHDVSAVFGEKTRTEAHRAKLEDIIKSRQQQKLAESGGNDEEQ